MSHLVPPGTASLMHDKWRSLQHFRNWCNLDWVWLIDSNLFSPPNSLHCNLLNVLFSSQCFDNIFFNHSAVGHWWNRPQTPSKPHCTRSSRQPQSIWRWRLKASLWTSSVCLRAGTNTPEEQPKFSTTPCLFSFRPSRHSFNILGTTTMEWTSWVRVTPNTYLKDTQKHTRCHI